MKQLAIAAYITEFLFGIIAVASITASPASILEKIFFISSFFTIMIMVENAYAQLGSTIEHNADLMMRGFVFIDQYNQDKEIRLVPSLQQSNFNFTLSKIDGGTAILGFLGRYIGMLAIGLPIAFWTQRHLGEIAEYFERLSNAHIY